MATQVPTTTGVFTRASSGLVRQVRTDDVMYYGWCQIALSYLIFIILAWGAYPGSSMELATILATVSGVLIGVCYALLSSVYPRSGGEYVFISRIIHPVVGFAVSMSFAFWEIFYFGINGAFLAIYAISPLLGTLGVQTSSSGLLSASTWFNHGWGVFLGGAAMIVFFVLLQYRGAGVYFRWQRWASFLAIGSLLATFIVLALAWGGALNFVSNFNHLTHAGEYQQIVAGQTVPGFSLNESLKFMLWPAFSIWFAVASVSFSGEVKNIQRGQLFGITAAMATMGVIMAGLMLFYRHAFGSNFILASATSTHYTLAAPPYVNVFTGIAGGNVAVTLITFIWVLAIALFVGATCVIYSTRAMLAWSIDGVAPEHLGDVNERHHSPHWAIVLSAVCALIWLAFYAFTSLLGPISGFLGFTVSFVGVSATAMVFPFVKKDVFDNSPIAWRLGGMPVISIIGFFATVSALFAAWRLLVDNIYTPNLAFSDFGALAVVVFAVIWFYAARAYRNAHGVNIDRRFQEIPIE